MTFPTTSQPESTPPASERSPTPVLPYAPAWRRPSAMRNWFWFLLKNVIGWLLILSAIVVGPLVPGPGGLPLFLIGFGLVTFPGKRRLTARVLSGVPVDPASRAYRGFVASTAILLPAAAIAYLVHKGYLPHHGSRRLNLAYVGAYAASALVLYVVGLRSVGLLNWGLRLVPKGRRKVRPLMRRWGIDLLPPRRRQRRLHAGGPPTRAPDQEILEIHERHLTRVARAWAKVKPWLRRVAGVVITALIFVWILKPVVHNWDAVRERILATSPARFLISAAMFAAFLFLFRALAWRRILAGFGHELPLAPAMRIWSTSELARYLPGVIWQVVGRVYLVKPYGVRGSVCSTSQVIELAIFLLANVLVAVACLVWFGIKSFDGPARASLFGAMALVPVLAFLLHPRVLYGIVNRVMRRLKKPVITERLSFGELLGLLAWTVLGLLWQSLAIWYLVSALFDPPLQLAKWWVVAGAYCLAWCAGFLAVWAPGGIGVRELVFMAAMQVALPPAVRRHYADNPGDLTAFLVFLSMLLRLWATAGELMLAAVAYAADRRGAFGRRDAIRPRVTAGATAGEDGGAVDSRATTTTTAR